MGRHVGRITIRGNRRILTEEIYKEFYNRRFTGADFFKAFGQNPNNMSDLVQCKILMVVDKTKKNLNIYQLSPDILKKAEGWC
jgi:hypothetical protein